ncbi:MAG: pantoate--beta-alanine ligase [Chloroflexota bacterium]
MKIVRSVADLRAELVPAHGRGSRIGLVPTMGALHAGHLSLIAAARGDCDQVVVSLFVNPAQFGRDEDLERYPRDEARDVALADAAGIDLLFAPDAEEMYPEGFDTSVDPGKLGTFLEGTARPGHFRGVATICTRLFLLVRPSRAYFGRKDAQQVAVVKQLVRDLELPVEIVACPTVRDPDGLALSSRNIFLSADERKAALALPRALEAGMQAYRSGKDAVRAVRQVLDTERGLKVDYVAKADLDGPTLAAAVMVGSTRLIDNVLLSTEV